MTRLAPPTLPRADHAGRRDRVRADLAAAGLGAMIVTAPTNVRYLTGFTGSNGQLMIRADTDVLITDARYAARAETEAPGVRVDLERSWAAHAVRLAGDVGHLAFESEHVTHAAATDLIARAAERRVGTRGVQGLVEQARMSKDAHELAALTHACAITDAAWAALLDHVRPGRTERELAVWLERTMVDLGADGRAFPSIVATGPNSAIPHHEPTDRALTDGDLLKVDFGARFAGYHADMTRTVSLGHPDDDLVAVHALVADAQQAGIDAIGTEAHTGDVDAACRDVIAEAGLADRFVHGTGHGVGLDIHEAPWLGGPRSRGESAGGARRSGRLPAGTVITVEPGVYLPGRGGVRIEDTVAVTADGAPRCLTTSPRDLLRL